MLALSSTVLPLEKALQGRFNYSVDDVSVRNDFTSVSQNIYLDDLNSFIKNGIKLLTDRDNLASDSFYPEMGPRKNVDCVCCMCTHGLLCFFVQSYTCWKHV